MKCDASKRIYCDTLEAHADLDGTKGLAWMSWMSVVHRSRKTALVLRGRRRVHDALVEFCPFCGGDVGTKNQPWRSEDGSVEQTEEAAS